MTSNVSTNRRERRKCERRKSNSKSNPRKRQCLQKPNGVIGRRVKKVGGARFAIVRVDPAKHRSEWIMADYFGNLLIEPQTLKHQGAFFKLTVELIRQTLEQHNIQETIVVVDELEIIIWLPNGLSPVLDSIHASYTLSRPNNIACLPILATKQMKPICMLNTERPLPDLDFASLSWNHPIGHCS